MENITLVVVKPPKSKRKQNVVPTDIDPQHTKVATEGNYGRQTEKQSQLSSTPTQQSGLSSKLLTAGAAACFADAITFPLDTAKVRLQIQGEALLTGTATGSMYRGVLGTLSTIRSMEGLPGWYSGLAAGLQRQMCFASIRIGLYDPMKQAYMNLFGVKKESRGGDMLGVRIMAGLTTGGLAVLAAQPTDVVKVRMQAQGGRGGVVRYTSNRHAYASIARTEGVGGLWKGVLPNMFRNSIVNVSELVSYDLIKEQLVTRRLLRDAMPCHMLSAVCAGFVTTTIASPVDVVKTRIMNSAPGAYTSALSCARDMLQNEGAAAFYKGFTPSFMRIGSWNVLMFVTYEQLKRIILERNVISDNDVFVTHYVAAAHTDNKNNNSSHTSLLTPNIFGQLM